MLFGCQACYQPMDAAVPWLLDAVCARPAAGMPCARSWPPCDDDDDGDGRGQDPDGRTPPLEPSRGFTCGSGLAGRLGMRKGALLPTLAGASTPQLA